MVAVRRRQAQGAAGSRVGDRRAVGRRAPATNALSPRHDSAVPPPRPGARRRRRGARPPRMIPRDARRRRYSRRVSTADAVALAAAVVACAGAVVVLVAAAVLVGQVRRLERGVEVLRHEATALVQDARRAAGLASDELARVDAVLAGTGAVTAHVDRAARMAERAFANPIVKLLAWRAGLAGGLRRLGAPAATADLRPSRPTARAGAMARGDDRAKGSGVGSDAGGPGGAHGRIPARRPSGGQRRQGRRAVRQIEPLGESRA